MAEKKKPLVLKLHRIDLLSLTQIDQLEQSFTCQVYLQFLVPHGARDPDLCKDMHVDRPSFPIGPDGRPTSRPSAAWYLNQLDFTNALDVRVVDKAGTLCLPQD